MKKKMKTLCNRLEFANEFEYYNYCIDSYENGQISQCKKLFKDMPKENRHELIGYIRDNISSDTIHNFYVNQF